MNLIALPFSYLLFILMFPLGNYVFKVINKIEIKGKENLPRTIKILYISSHRTFIDSLLIGIGLINIKELFFSYRRIPWNAPDKKNFYTNKFGILFMKLLKNIPIDRHRRGETYTNYIIDSYCKILKKGNLLLFPEGGRTKGETEMDKCKSGIAKTILLMTQEDADFKVVPIYLGKEIKEIMPKEVGQKYLKIKSGKKGKMIIGEPVDFSEICKLQISENEKIRLIQEKVRSSIVTLKT